MEYILTQTAVTKYYRMSGLNNRNFLLLVLDATSLRSGYQHSKVQGRALFLA